MYKLYAYSPMLRRWVPAVGAPEFGYRSVVDARLAARALRRYWPHVATFIRYPRDLED